MTYASIIDREQARIEERVRAEQHDNFVTRPARSALKGISAENITPAVLVILLNELLARAKASNFAHQDLAIAAIEDIEAAGYALKAMERQDSAPRDDSWLARQDKAEREANPVAHQFDAMLDKFGRAL